MHSEKDNLEPLSITGVILAGGAARRMGGHDKGWVNYDDRPLIEHVLQRLTPQVSNIIISANRELDRYQSFGFPVVVDQSNTPKTAPEEMYFEGPLSGIISALRQVTTTHAVIVPVDAPLLSSNLVETLTSASLASNGSSAPLTLVHDGKRLQPLFGLYKRTLLASLECYFEAGNRKLLTWCKQQSPVVVPAPQLRPSMINLNSPDNIKSLESSQKPPLIT